MRASMGCDAPRLQEMDVSIRSNGRMPPPLPPSTSSPLCSVSLVATKWRTAKCMCTSSKDT